jgi:hypothetical protein
MRIEPATAEEDIVTVRALTREYETQLGVRL